MALGMEPSKKVFAVIGFRGKDPKTVPVFHSSPWVTLD